MSHDATNWAIKQRGLSPAAKVVLWHLCDRYHPDNGCFPSQQTLAADCEISRAGLNNILTDLEQAGLIAREQRRNEQTNRQKSTAYHFAFERDFVAKPSPESGHGKEAEAVSNNCEKPSPENGESRVQNLDTNPVREPVSITSNLRESVRDAGEGNEETEAQPENTKTRNDRIERDFKRWYRTWPTYVTDSEASARKVWFGLNDAERADALALTARFIETAKASGRTKFVSAQIYLREKQWQRLEAKAGKAGGPVLSAAFGKAWMAMRLSELLKPCAALPPLAPATQKAIVAGMLNRAKEDQLHREKHGWPVVSRMHAKAQEREGVYVAQGLAELGEGFQSVKVGSELCQAWEALHRARGWPWMPMGKWEWLYMPKADGLDVDSALRRFQEALTGGRSDEHAA